MLTPVQWLTNESAESYVGSYVYHGEMISSGILDVGQTNWLSQWKETLYCYLQAHFVSRITQGPVDLTILIPSSLEDSVGGSVKWW